MSVYEFVFIIDIRNLSGFGHLSRSSILAYKLSRTSKVKLLLIGEKLSEQHLFFLDNLDFELINSYEVSYHLCKMLVVDDYLFTLEDLKLLNIKTIKTVLLSDMPSSKSKGFDYIIDININSNIEDYTRLGLHKQNLLIDPKFNLINNRYFKAREDYRINQQVSTIGLYLGHQKLEVYNNVFAEIIKNRDVQKVIVFTDYNDFDSEKITVEKVSFSENIVSKMLECDIIVGSAGTNAWERAVIGIPSIYISFHALHQKPIIKLESLGFGYRLDHLENFDYVFKKISNYEFRCRIKNVSERYFDSEGRIKLIEKLYKICVAL